MYASCLLAALILSVPPAAVAAPVEKASAGPGEPLPDLGLMRFAWPSASRQLWLGVGVGGVYIPGSVSGFSRDVWTVRAPVGWAFAAVPRVHFGGRHAMVWYDSRNARTRLGEHSGEVAIELGPLDPRLRHRLLFSGEVRELDKFTVNASGVQIAIGGVRDAILGVGYGTRVVVGRSWALSGLVHARYVWVFTNTQRQGRLAFRVEHYPRPNHVLSASLVGHLVHRDAEQYAKELPRMSTHAQAEFGYGWLSPPNESATELRWGFYLKIRGATSFLSGEAPVYEVRADGLTTPYADASGGVHMRW